MAQTRPSPTLSRGLTRLGRLFVREYVEHDDHEFAEFIGFLWLVTSLPLAAQYSQSVGLLRP